MIGGFLISSCEGVFGMALYRIDGVLDCVG